MHEHRVKSSVDSPATTARTREPGFGGRFAPLAGWPLPDRSPTLRRLLEARLNKHAGREYVQVLRLPGKGGEKNFYPITVSN